MADQRDVVIDDVIKIIEFARERGETDLRQLREWVRRLKTQNAAAFIASMEE